MGTKSLVRSFRSTSVAVYLLNIVAITSWYVSYPIYLNVLIGTMCSIISLTMLLVASNGPKIFIKTIDTPRFAFLFTFRGRYILDLYVSLFLYAMGLFGILMATITLGLIFGIRFAGVKHPEAFRILFRQSADYDDEGTVYTEGGETFDGTYDGTYDGTATLESGRR